MSLSVKHKHWYSPTQELATQIQSVVLALGDYMNVQCHVCIGGTSIGEDIRKLEYGQHVVSGTPGRVFDRFGDGAYGHGIPRCLFLTRPTHS